LLKFLYSAAKENNLDAGLKKLEDTYDDVNDDINLYQNIISSNIKLSADLTALSALILKDQQEISAKKDDISKIVDLLDDLYNSVNNGTINVTDIELSNNNGNNEEFNQLLSWIISDINLIGRGIEIAHDTNLFKRYTRLI